MRVPCHSLCVCVAWVVVEGVDGVYSTCRLVGEFVIYMQCIQNYTQL